MTAHLVVVPHTHWDREWYRTREQFRFRLVRLLDGLLDLLDRDPEFRHFTLDGQLVVVDDYLEVRPEARQRLAAHVRSGRLLVGPWYVLPDEWLVSGEALIRNLRLGLERASLLGGAMQIGYVPDQFGHVGQLPQIFAGFGFDAAVLWRGVGHDVAETLFRWESPDGSGIDAVYLVHGYGNAMHLPLERDALAARLQAVVGALKQHSRVPSLLLMNGSDHLEPQPGLPAALAEAVPRLGDASFEISTLPAFVERARREVSGSLPLHRGELRSGLRSPLLEGCASSRAAHKRMDFANDRLLTAYVEPLSAWLQALGGDADPGMIALAWRIALENHPHDSICGCSIDAVHDEMDVRFARVDQIAQSHLRRVAGELARRVATSVDGPGDRIVVWNPGAAGRVAVEGELELDLSTAGRTGRAIAVHVRNAAGQRIPAHAEIVEAGRVEAAYTLEPGGARVVVNGFPPEFMGQWVRSLRWCRRGDRLLVDLVLGSDPRTGFDGVAARAAFCRALDEEAVGQVEFRALRLPRVAVRFADELPGCGLREYRVVKGRAGREPLLSETTPDGGAAIENRDWRIQVDPEGRVCCIHRASGARIEDAVRLVSEGDRGDSYNFDPVPGDSAVERPKSVRVRLAASSEAQVGIRIEARYRVPRQLEPGRDRRSSRETWLPVQLLLRLGRDLDRVDLEIDADNTARDHRLRVHVRAPFSATRFEVESAFEVAERPIDPAPGDFGSARPAEFPIGATPQRRFATLSGDEVALTLANRGCAEVEAVSEPEGCSSLAVTLLRATGWLSRQDLALRPGHAGPPLEIPGAQVPGPHRVELSWRLHPPGDPSRIPAALHFACPAWAFAGEGDDGAPLADGARLLQVDDPQVIVSAIEPRADGAASLRVFNAGRVPVRTPVTWNGPGARSLAVVDLAGRPIDSADFEPGDGATGTLSLRAGQILTLCAGPGPKNVLSR